MGTALLQPPWTLTAGQVRPVRRTQGVTVRRSTGAEGQRAVARGAVGRSERQPGGKESGQRQGIGRPGLRCQVRPWMTPYEAGCVLPVHGTGSAKPCKYKQPCHDTHKTDCQTSNLVRLRH